MKSFLILACAISTISAACSKEEYAAKFGATYELLPTPAPRIQGNKVIVSVRYLSKCTEGGSTFQSFAKDLPSDMNSFDVLLLSRNEPKCTNPAAFSSSYIHEVSIPIPTFPINTGFVGKDLMIAFPPEGAYQIYKLQDHKERSTTPTPDHKETTTSMKEVQAELATQSIEDSVAFLEHCETSKFVHENDNCSPMMMKALKKKIEYAAAMSSSSNITGDPTEEEGTLSEAAEVNLMASMATEL